MFILFDCFGISTYITGMRMGFCELEWVLVNDIVVPIVSHAVGKP